MLLVIGYGNPLRSDDGIGQVVVKALEARVCSSAVGIITTHQLTPELAEPISRSALTIFVDSCEGDQPGAVACETVAAETTAGAFTHNVTPASLLSAAKELYGCAPAGLIVSITGASFDYGNEISPQLTSAMPHITDQLIGLIDKDFSI